MILEGGEDRKLLIVTTSKRFLIEEVRFGGTEWCRIERRESHDGLF